MTITILRREDHRPELLASAGRPRIGLDVAVVNEDGARVAPEAVGEVVVPGPW